MSRSIYLLAVLSICISVSSTAQQVSTLVTSPGATFEAITWAADGSIFVVDFGSGEVFKMSNQGALTLIDIFSTPLGGAVDDQGNFYFSEYGLGRIIKVSPDLSHEVYATDIGGPAGILIDSSTMTMYVAAYSADVIVRLDMSQATPSPEVFADDPLLQGPDGLVFAPDGDIISANFNNSNVQRIHSDGAVTPFASIPGSSSGYLVNFGQGYLITGANSSHRVFYIDPEGMVSDFAGTGTAGNVDGDSENAQFIFPNGIAISPGGDSLLIAQSHNSGRIRLITDVLPTDLSDAESDLSLRLSPNPAEDSIRLSWKAGQRIDQIKLFDLNGAEVHRWNLKGISNGHAQLTLPELFTGHYLIRIETDQGSISRTVIIQ